MTKKRLEIREAMEDVALAGAIEMKKFLDTYRGDDRVARTRVQVATNAVTGYTRQCASENNMIAMLLAATDRTGVSPEQTLAIVQSAGFIPATAAASPERAKLQRRSNGRRRTT